MSTLVTVIYSVMENMDQLVPEMNFLSERNRQSIRSWQGDIPPTSTACIHHKIEAQALARPDAPAVFAWDDSFTYGQLNSLAERVANHLVAAGVGPEVLVPLCFEKSAWTYVGILAVLKAGGAYVPLNPQHPKPRLVSIVRRSGASVVLSSPENFDLCKSLVDNVVLLSPGALAAMEASPRTSNGVTSQNVAYVMFTSGSTGEPKGVVVNHGSFVSASQIHGEDMLYGPETRLLQFAAYSFDTSIDEIFTTLLFGGCVCVPSEWERLNNIAGAINRMQVNYAMLTPSAAALIEPKDVPELRVLTLVGEAVTKGLIETWAPRVLALNGYGPSECSVITTVNRLHADTHPSNIGFPSGCRCWIVDPKNRSLLAPIGCVGELVVQGPSLARCYLDDPVGTNAAFFHSPPWYEDATLSPRFYATGDLVRYGPGGSISLLGRKDTQIKHHGQRIELGGIEHFFSTQSWVRHAMVLVPDSGPCRDRLAAVLSPRDITYSSRGEILQPLSGPEKASALERLTAMREDMWQELPSYMVPSIWVVVNTLPTLESRKLDRRCVKHWLEYMDQQMYLDIVNATIDTNGTSHLSVTPLQSQIRQVWSEVLNIPFEQINFDAPFYSLGGDSITAMQVVARCRSVGIILSVQAILRDKTVSKVAQSARFSQQQQVNIQPEAITKQAFELSPAQKMHFNMVPNGEDHFNQSFILDVSREVSSGAIFNALLLTARRHHMLGARFQKRDDGNWQQFIPEYCEEHFSRLFHTFTVSSLEELKEKAALQQRSINIHTGAVFTASLFKTWDDRQLLYLVAHHLVIDLMSWRIILHDVESSLTQAVEPERHDSLPFPVWSQMQADFSRQHILHSTTLPFQLPASGHLSFWGMGPHDNVYGDVLEKHFTVDEHTTSLLFENCNAAFQTDPVDILLVAILHSFHQVFPDRQAPIIHNEGHGREPWSSEIDLSETVGWFTTMCPLYVDFHNDDQDILHTIRRVKDTRRATPTNGWSYFTSLYLDSKDGNANRVDSSMELLFNFHGRYQQLERDGALLRQITERLCADVGDNVPRAPLIEISATVSQGKLDFNFVYNSRIERQNSLFQWVESCESTMYQLVRRLEPMKELRFTLSDFPLVPFTYESMDLFFQDMLSSGNLSAADIEDIYPCSLAQEGILLSRSKNHSHYRVCFILEVSSAQTGVHVNPEALGRSWQRVVDYHSILRTVFVEGAGSDGRFMQVVVRNTGAKTVLLRDHGHEEAIETLRNYRFLTDNSNQPPHELIICTADDGKVFARFELSHAITDASSTPILLHDLCVAYNNPDEPLPSLPRSTYRDFIAHIQNQAATSHLDYWVGYLQGVQPCLFPTGVGQYTEDQTMHSTTVKLGDVSRLLRILKDRQWTLADLIRTAWAVILRLYTGSNTVCFGQVVTGRDVPIDGIEKVAGLFINMLACRLNIGPGSTVASLVEQMQTDFIDSLPYQNCPLAEVQHALQLGGQPLFNTAISIQKQQYPQSTTSTPLTFSHVDGKDPTEVRMNRDLIAVISLSNFPSFLYLVSLHIFMIKPLMLFYSTILSLMSSAQMITSPLNLVTQAPSRNGKHKTLPILLPP